MALLLFIDTSSKNCSVLLAEDKRELSSRIEYDTRSHAQILPMFIKEVLSETGKDPKSLDAIVVSAGPGSYTGLRIGMSTAKGMCYTLNIPFIALDSLECLARTMLNEQGDEEGIYLATLDSRKGEIYFAAMDGIGEMICPSQPAIVEELDWDKWNKSTVYISGNTQEKLKNISTNLDLNPIKILYSANNYINKGFNSFINKTFDNPIYKEPNYLKPFQ